MRLAVICKAWPAGRKHGRSVCITKKARCRTSCMREACHVGSVISSSTDRREHDEVARVQFSARFGSLHTEAARDGILAAGMCMLCLRRGVPSAAGMPRTDLGGGPVC